MTDRASGDIRDLLPDLLHGSLDAVRRSAVEGHVATCAECRAELELLDWLRDIARRPAKPASIDVSAIVRVLPSPGAPVRVGHRAWRRAAALVAITVGGASYAIVHRETGAGVRAVAPAVRVARVNGRESASAVARSTEPSPANVSSTHRSAPRSLPVEGAVGDLSDRELGALLAGLRTLDGLPSASAETENASLAPATERGER